MMVVVVVVVGGSLEDGEGMGVWGVWGGARVGVWRAREV